MKEIKFYQEAEIEMIESAKYYEEKQDFLGKPFLATIESSIKRIQINPNLYTEIEPSIRRCIASPFPSGIVYRESD